MRSGDVVWCDLPRVGRHPAVVLEVAEGAVLLAAVGTSSVDIDARRVTVAAGTRAAIQLQLQATTHFYAHYVQWVQATRCRPTGRRCTGELLRSLSDLADEILEGRPRNG